MTEGDDEPEGLDDEPTEKKIESDEDEELEDGLDDSSDEEGLDDEIQETKPEPSKNAESKEKKVTKGGSQRRTYRISITYDFYYNTPRMWIQGSNEKGLPLTEAEIYEDIMSDYKGKTVTMEKHPHLGRTIGF